MDLIISISICKNANVPSMIYTLVHITYYTKNLLMSCYSEVLILELRNDPNIVSNYREILKASFRNDIGLFWFIRLPTNRSWWTCALLNDNRYLLRDLFELNNAGHNLAHEWSVIINSFPEKYKRIALIVNNTTVYFSHIHTVITIRTLTAASLAITFSEIFAFHRD